MTTTSNFSGKRTIKNLGISVDIHKFENIGKISYSLAICQNLQEGWETTSKSSAIFEELGLGSTNKSGSFDPKKYVAFISCPDKLAQDWEKATEKERENLLAEVAEKLQKAGFRVISLTATSPLKTKGTNARLSNGEVTLEEIAEKQIVPNSSPSIYRKNYVLNPGQKVSDLLADVFGIPVSKEDINIVNEFKIQILNPDLTFETVDTNIEVEESF